MEANTDDGNDSSGDEGGENPTTKPDAVSDKATHTMLTDDIGARSAEIEDGRATAMTPHCGSVAFKRS